MKNLGVREEGALVEAVTLVDKDGMRIVVEALKDHQASENQALLVQVEVGMTHR